MLETVFLRHESQAQAELARQQALHDPLTGLLNRFGHPTGDRLLAQVAGRLRQEVRPDDIVARLGGDEFMVLIAGALDEAASTRLASTIIAALETPFVLGNDVVSISASIGITVTCGRPFDLARLQAEADRALYAAKGMGRRQAVWFDTVPA